MYVRNIRNTSEIQYNTSHNSRQNFYVALSDMLDSGFWILDSGLCVLHPAFSIPTDSRPTCPWAMADMLRMMGLKGQSSSRLFSDPPALFPQNRKFSTSPPAQLLEACLPC